MKHIAPSPTPNPSEAHAAALRFWLEGAVSLLLMLIDAARGLGLKPPAIKRGGAIDGFWLRCVEKTLFGLVILEAVKLTQRMQMRPMPRRRAPRPANLPRGFRSAYCPNAHKRALARLLPKARRGDLAAHLARVLHVLKHLPCFAVRLVALWKRGGAAHLILATPARASMLRAAHEIPAASSDTS